MTAQRVVVVGNGMVAARFVADLHELAGLREIPTQITVIGEEPHEPYNRLLLSEVVAGRASLGGLTLPAAPATARVFTGVRAVRIDRATRQVVDEHGTPHPYDTLVLATGADARIPFDTKGIHGIKTLRTIDDCRELIAAIGRVRRVGVLGGGLLGVELACGLRTREVSVALVHHGDRLMERQLDPASAQVAAGQLRRLGIDVVTGTTVAQLQERDGQLTGVELTDGRQLDMDLLVVSAGVAPRTELAAAAGLTVEHGIVVGADLRSVTDPAIAAIGDCAQEDSRWTGLIAPGWDQSRRLAALLTGDSPSGPADTVTTDVVTLKAVGLSVVTAGRIDPNHRVVQLADPTAGRCTTVAVHQGRVTGAACVGDPAVAADLVAAYEHRTPAPTDPAALLVKGIGTAAAPTPRTMPDSATVCRCNGVTKKDIVQAHLAGLRRVDEVATRTRATTGCGGCHDVVSGLLEWMDQVDPQPNPESTDCRAAASDRRNR